MNVATTPELSKNAEDFIDDAHLTGLLEKAPPDPARVHDIIAKGLDKKPLTVAETAALLRIRDRDLIKEVFDAARQLKRNVYGNRIVLFAPLYVGNKCINDCRYCGFRASNDDALRHTLSPTNLHNEVEALERQGHKRLIMVWGEHPDYSPEHIAEYVQKVYDTRTGPGEIRRVNINAAPLDKEGYGIVKEAGIGTYQIFQETYHHETYRQMHPTGTRKADYLWRLDGLHRAFEAGCDDVGIGALFGLYDWRFEVLGLVKHALHLQQRYGVGCHTISFPRLRPASGVGLDDDHLVSDFDFKRIIATLRIAVPYTGLILTAREKPELRRDVMDLGVSQIDAGSRIELGGYSDAEEDQQLDREQFSLGDVRPLDEVMRELMQDGYVPSFCTACYRLGRTGEEFMEYAIPGFIQEYCTPNALSTLQEYLVDYASPRTREVGERLIQQEMNKVPESMHDELIDRLTRIKTSDERDLYF